MSVSRARQEVSSREFVDWAIYLDELPNRFDATHHYLAQVAAEVRRLRNLVAVIGSRKQPKKVLIKEFLLEFESHKVEKLSDEELARRQLLASKARWGLITGIDIPVD